MAYLKPLNQVIATELISYDRDSLVQELVDRITADSNWNSLWDGELLQNFSYFIINTFAYLFEKNAEHANRIIKEAFVVSSKDPQSLINYLSNYNLNLKQNSPSIATVRLRPADGSSFTKYFTLTAGTLLPATNINGGATNYEIYLLDENNKIDYRAPLEVNPQNFVNFTAYSGDTTVETYSINSNIEREKFKYNITNTDIIDGSLRIYYEYNTINEVELIETDSFVIEPIITTIFTSQLGGVPHYKILYNTDGSASILFGTSRFGGSFPASGGTLTFIYRVGGGSTSNITAGGINYTTTVPVDNFTSLSVNFFNLLGGGAGSDREDLDEARYYAPYRVGRGRSIIDDRDVVNTLFNSCVKHIVKSPKYNTYSVPVLHYYNYIVPYRDFNNFTFPIPEDSDTAESYKIIFEKSLNDYCNLQGLHDGVENDILISFFRSTNFSFPLPLKPILNSSLSTSAYDKNGIEIDRLQWSGNYLTITENYPDEPEINASITSNIKIPSIGIISGNNSIRLKIDTLPDDYIIPSGSTIKTSEYYDIIIPAGTYSLDSNGFNTVLAEAINLGIRNIDPYYSSFPISTKFAYLDTDGKLVISSPTVGEISSVRLFVTSNSILNNFGFISEKVYANPQNRKIFAQTSLYDSEQEEVFISLNNSNWSISELKNNLVPLWVSGSVNTGPSISFNITDSDGNIVYLEEATNFTIEAIQNSQVNDTLYFNNVNSLALNYGSADVGTVFDDTNPDVCFFDYTTSTITMKLTDSNGTDGDYSYPREDDNETELYNSNTVFRLSYNKKPYHFITTSLNPNPYHNEGEALGFSQLLTTSGRKQFGVEPLIKKINFVPYGVEVFVKPTNGYTRQEAITSTITQIYNNFSYDNTNADLNIGTGLVIQNLISILNDKTILPQVQRIRFTLPSEDYIDSNGNSYYFVLPESFLNRIINYETTYPQITGLNNYYKVRVVAE